ncbi:hypothetical protein V8C42DRAFT_306106 [Trichoderma barbatum]
MAAFCPPPAHTVCAKALPARQHKSGTPYGTDETYNIDTSTAFINGITTSYTAEPRIISQLFMLGEEWNISNDRSIVSSLFPEGDDIFDMQVCPHLGLMSTRVQEPRRLKRWIVEGMMRHEQIARLGQSLQ